MTRIHSIVISVFLLVGVVLAGCNQASSKAAKNGVLMSAGLSSASDINFVVLQPSEIFKVTDSAAISRLYNTVNQPDRNFVSKMARNRLMAFVGHNGKTAYVIFSDGGDITARQGSSQLMRLARLVYGNSANKDTTRIATKGFAEVRIATHGKVKVISTKAPKWKTVSKYTADLIGLWNPDDLRGCKHASKNEVDVAASRYIDVKLARQVAFSTLIVPKNFEWWPPPETVDTRTRFEEIRVSTIRVLSVRTGQMRLAFDRGGGKSWVLSPVLATRKFLGYSSQGQAKYGDDLYEAAIK